MYGCDLEINVVEVNISDLSIHSDTGREKENLPPDASKSLVPLSLLKIGDRKEPIMAENKTSFTGNVERSIQISKMGEISKVTAEKPRLIVDRDGVALYKASVVVAIDRNFPTKAGNTTTTVVIVPIDGAKEFPFNGGKVKMDGIAPFIYAGRGVSHVFTTYTENGDVMKRSNTRRSASAEVAELKKQLDAIMAMLSKQ